MEYDIIRQHHRLNGHEFEQTLGDSEGQGSPWGCKASNMTVTKQQQTNKNPLYSTEHSGHNSIRTVWRRIVKKKEWIYHKCIIDSFYCIPETNTTL